MVDVNTQVDVKGYGLPVMPAITTEDRVKPQVKPVPSGSEGQRAALHDQALQGNTKEAQEKQRSLSQEEVAKVAEDIQARLDSIGSNLQIGLNQDKKSESIVVQVSDRSSGDVIRQVPTEDLLALKKKLEERVGLLFDTSA